MKFSFFGRLEKEKGFDTLLKVLQLSLKNNSKHTFYIFGTGSLLSELKNIDHIDLSTQNWGTVQVQLQNLKHTQTTQVIYFGHRDTQSEILPFIQKNTDYTLIPSSFLETFGLTALESITVGVPILTTNQPALNEFNIYKKYLHKTPSQILEQLNSLPPLTQSQKDKLISHSKNYSSKNWLIKFKSQLPPKSKKILFVSDFSDKIGGVENHIQTISTLLNKEGFICEHFFGSTNQTKISQFKAIYNLHSSKLLQQKIQQFQPDVIWCHSVQRHLGTKTLKVINQSSVHKIISIHDLGLFTAYPSQLTDLKNINQQNKTISFKLKNQLIIQPIFKQLNKFNTIFISHNFIKQLLLTSLQSKAYLLPHFIDNAKN